MFLFRSAVHKNESTGRWCVPFPGSDRSVVQRTQRFFYENEKKRPTQFNAYVVVGTLFNVIALGIFGAILTLFVKFEFGRNLLLKVFLQ